MKLNKFKKCCIFCQGQLKQDELILDRLECAQKHIHPNNIYIVEAEIFVYPVYISEIRNNSFVELFLSRDTLIVDISKYRNDTIYSKQTAFIIKKGYNNLSPSSVFKIFKNHDAYEAFQ